MFSFIAFLKKGFYDSSENKKTTGTCSYLHKTCNALFFFDIFSNFEKCFLSFSFCLNGSFVLWGECKSTTTKVLHHCHEFFYFLNKTLPHFSVSLLSSKKKQFSIPKFYCLTKYKTPKKI
jgi:hypothetical protein